MEFYPINLKLNKKKVLIVGGGSVAFRKFKKLMNTGAQITIVSPDFTADFEKYLKQNLSNCIFLKRKFEEKDLINQFLIFAATDNKDLNKSIAFLARAKNILVNVIDNPEQADFTVPAAVSRGDLLLTVSSGSNLPALSKNIRKKLDKNFGLEYKILLELMSEQRQKIISEVDNIDLRKKIFKKLAADDFLNKIKEILASNNLKRKTAEDIEKAKYLKVLAEVETEIVKIIVELKNNYHNRHNGKESLNSFCDRRFL